MPYELAQIGLFRCFSSTITLDTSLAGPSDYVIIPPDAEQVSVQLSVLGSCVACVEASISTEKELKAGTALWKVWDMGNATGGAILQDATRGPVGAIRANVIVPLAGNNVILSVRTQGEQY